MRHHRFRTSPSPPRSDPDDRSDRHSGYYPAESAPDRRYGRPCPFRNRRNRNPRRIAATKPTARGRPIEPMFHAVPIVLRVAVSPVKPINPRRDDIDPVDRLLLDGPQRCFARDIVAFDQALTSGAIGLISFVLLLSPGNRLIGGRLHLDAVIAHESGLKYGSNVEMAP